MAGKKSHKWFRTAHKWAGLTAAAWLAVLGVTGILLDHPDWRPLNQLTVPESWGSPDLTRFIRITYMRQILVDPDDRSDWLGGSERGLWHSDDGGESWQSVDFSGVDHTPQVRVLVLHPDKGFERTIVATDDGLWQRTAADTVERLALAGKHINSLAVGGGNLVGVVDRSVLFELDIGDGSIKWTTPAAIEPVIAGEVAFSRYLLNLHFGHGLVEGAAGIFINDFGGFAMLVLACSGFLYWFLRRRWRRNPDRSPTADRKRTVTAWLYRSHGPIIGILGVLPILYLALTGLVADHIRAIYTWASETQVPAYLVPAGFSMRSLEGDIQDVVTYPGAPLRLTMATRKGLFHSSDGGVHWTIDHSMPIQKADYGNSLHLFRIDDTLFLGAGVNASFSKPIDSDQWRPVTGLLTGISSGAKAEGQWFLKNSQGAFTGELDGELQMTDVNPPPLEGMPLFLFLADVHTGLAIAPWFPFVNDLVAILAVVLVVSGPVIWWRRRWM